MQPIDSATTSADATPAPLPPPVARRCENCGSPLYGDHCFACGQPTKGMVRHFSTILGDFVDTVFNIDSRVLRTIGPLLFRPGCLSLEYFAGRRVRYVTPMRLFLFLSLIAFFAVQGSIEFDEDGKSDEISVGAQRPDAFDQAQTAAEVIKVRDQLLAEVEKRRERATKFPAGNVGVELATEGIKSGARDRLRYLAQVEKARAEGKPPAPVESAGNNRGNFNFPVHGKPWHPKTNPVDFELLPAAVNQSLNRRVAHAKDVLEKSDSEKPVVDAMFNVLPQTLIVLMPIFALMLKVLYLFKRRLYMEHLIVALHSHAFIALAVTLIMGWSWLIGLVADDGFWDDALNWLRALTIAWIPLYLLIMQKRVYGQGWILTLLKYGVLGLCYSVLLFFGMVSAGMIGLLTL